MKLDEQFFQSLLSAAFTVQEFNDRQLSGCITEHTAEIPELPKRGPNISARSTEAIESEEASVRRIDRHNGSGDQSMEQSRCTPNFYLDLLNSIGEEGQITEATTGTTKDAEKVVGSPVERRTDNLNFSMLRILEAGEDDHKKAGDSLSSSAVETDASEVEEKDRPELQASQVKEKILSSIEQCVVQICDSQTDDHLLRSVLDEVLQTTHATTAAVALGHLGKLSCRDSLGESASEVRAMIDTGLGFTTACASKGAMQFCPNTTLDHRADAQACHKFGVRTVIFIPFFHKDQLLGLMAAFSRKPYAFGVREIQALQDLVEKFAGKLQIDARPANAELGRSNIHASNVRL